MKYLIYFWGIFFIFGCSNASTEEDTEISSDTTESIERGNSETEFDDTILIIEGKDIWVRDKPVTGEVIMKLNTGDKCKVIDKTEVVQVRDMKDRWYKIEFNGTIGWVFGSQTNLKTGLVGANEFADFFKTFIKLYKEDIRNIDKFIHKEIGIYYLYVALNDCEFVNEEDIYERNIPESIPIENIFNKKIESLQVSNTDLQKGFYFSEILIGELPYGVHYEGNTHPEFQTGKLVKDYIPIPEKYNANTIIRVSVISEENSNIRMYFIDVENIWYLFCENHCI